MFIHKTEVVGLVVSLALLFYIKGYYKRKSDLHENTFHKNQRKLATSMGPGVQKENEEDLATLKS